MLGLCLASLAVSCASLPAGSGITPASPEVAISIMRADQLQAMFGPDSPGNPYIEPVGLFTGRKDEFVVACVEIAALGPVHLEATAELLDGDGKAQGFLGKDDFLSYWGLPDESLRDGARRARLLENSYLPTLLGRIRPGLYYVVAIARYPIARPATVRFSVRTGTSEVKEFSFELLAPGS